MTLLEIEACRLREYIPEEAPLRDSSISGSSWAFVFSWLPAKMERRISEIPFLILGTLP